MAAEYGVDIKLKVRQAYAQLNKLSSAFKKVDRSIEETERKLQQMPNAFRRVGSGAQRAFKQFETAAVSAARRAQAAVKRFADRSRASLKKFRAGLTGVKGALAGLATAAAAQQALQAGIQREESIRRLTFLAKGYGEVAALQNAATAASKKFGQSQTEANKALANIYARLRPIGTSLEDITSVYNGFNTAARVSGASAVEASNAFTQLAQGLGSGALRGDEFNSIAEQVPAVLTAISKETGVAQGALRDFAATGGITSDIVLNALKRIEEEGADQLTAALNGPAQKIKDFQNAFEDVQVALTTQIIPEMTPAIVDFTALLKEMTPIISGISKAFAFLFRLVVSQSRAAKEALDNIFAGRFGELFKVNSNWFDKLMGVDTGPKKVSYPVQQFRYDDGLEATQMRERARRAAEAANKGKKAKSPTALGGLDKSGLSLANSKALLENQLAIEQATLANNRALVRELEIKREFIAIDNEISILQSAIANTERDRGKLLAKNISNASINQRIQEATDRILQLQNDKLAKQSVLRTDFANDVIRLGGLIGKDLAGKIEEANEEASLLDTTFQQIGSTIKQGLTSAITDLIEGGKKLQSIFSDLLKQVGRMLINAGLSSLGGPGGLFGAGGIPGFSSGGIAPAGRPSLVGERGPELIVPSTATAVIPNDGFAEAAAAMVGSPAGVTADPFSESAQAMSASAAAIQTRTAAEAAAAMAGGNGSMTIQTQVINSVEYATVDQVQAASAAAAKEARARVFGELKNKPARRAGIGL